MKIGLISDIHGDPHNLSKALTLLQDQGCNDLLCAGDLVEKGPDGDEVVRMIREYDIATVAGNHDLMAPGNQKWLRESMGSDSPMLLEEETLNWLADLPRTLLFGWQDTRILVAHGSPNSPNTYLYHYLPGYAYHAEIGSVDADIVVVGHTHQPMEIRYRDKLVLNPGSVCGRIFDSGSQTCATLNLPDRMFIIYDLTTGQSIRHTIRDID